MDNPIENISRECIQDRDSFYFVLGKNLDDARRHRWWFYWSLTLMVIFAITRSSVFFVGLMGVFALIYAVTHQASLKSLREFVCVGASKGYPIPIKAIKALKIKTSDSLEDL